uniref:THAP domain-containing protein n=1 Tax=Rhipicephalus zambeziensis TaxID=60191 RepID=A0A224YH22_9ACAR
MASSRPHRNCARRLSPEAISGILDDLSDSMDDPDDPDFMVGSDEHHHKRTPTKRARHLSSGSSSTSDTELIAQPPKRAIAPLRQVATPSSGTIITVVKPGFSVLEDANITQHTPTTHGARYICCVKNCASRGLSNLDGLWLFPLPQDEPTRQLWLEQVPIDLEGNRPASPRVCFRHFDSSKFVRRQQRLLGLQKGAIPSSNTGVTQPSTKSNTSKNYITKTALVTPMRTTVPAGTVATQSLARVSTAVDTKGHQIPQSSTTPSKPKNEIFIDLTSEEVAADVKVGIGKSQLAAVSCGTATNGPGHTSHAENSLVAANGMGPLECVDVVNDDGYELTLEDIEEELPWVVPDMHWDSRLDDNGLHLVWNNSPDTNSCKKVVLDQDRRVSVYVGEKQVVLTVQKITDIQSLKQLFTELGKL